MEKTDVVVIGGGIIGTSAAFFLSREGVDVTLVERFEIGLEASGSNAGSMALQNKELALLPLVQESLRTWAELQAELQEDLEYRQNGGFRVAENNEQLQVLRRSVDVQKKMGLEVELLTPQEFQPVAPYLGPSVVAASFCDKDARGNPLLSSLALARAAEARGARIRVNEEVTRIEANSGGQFTVGTSRGEYRTTCILNSAGVWAKNIFRMVGLDYPITLDTQQVMVTEQVPSIFPHVITHVEGNLTLKQMDSGNVLIGGGWKGIGDMDNNIKRVRYESLIGNLRYACRVIPSLNDLNLIRCWAGLEGRSPDLLPVFGNLNRLPGFYSSCCTKGGFTLGPILGKLISELIVKGKTSFQMKAFDVNRFIDHM